MQDKKTSTRINDMCDLKVRLLAAAVSESNDAITVQDLQGRITAWNRGAERMYGYTEKEALSMHVSEIIPPDKREEAEILIEEVRAGKNVQSVQTRRIDRSGNIIEVWLTLTKIVDDDGAIIGIASSERDITGHYKLLEEVETSFSLAEEYANDIDRLVAERTASLIALNIADRVINPAVVIGMTCSNLLSRDGIDEEERTKIERIREESDKLQRIVQDFTDIVNRKTTLFQYEDLNAVVKEAAVLIKKGIDEKGINLEVSLSQKPLMINMNKNVLRTAIYYIFKNALEATPRSGTIKARTSENSDSVSLMISDTGCGIGEKKISRIFDHFFTTKSKGLGMGLPFVKHIVEEHYGTLMIESEESCGTTCIITFPMRWLKFSDGSLLWEKPMLPVKKEIQEYPLPVDTRPRGSGEDDQG